MKYHGYIGYAVETETYPGVWEEQITEHEYFGEVIKNRTNIQQDTSMCAGIRLNHTISVIGDPFAYENYYNIRYVTHLGKKWKVTSVEIERPRLQLQIGDVYNG